MTAPIRLTIDQWYDRHDRVWITQVRRGDTNEQVGDAIIDGNKADAIVSKRYLRSQIKRGAIRPEADYGTTFNADGAIVIRTR